jgi:hypothetical protein
MNCKRFTVSCLYTDGKGSGGLKECACGKEVIIKANSRVADKETERNMLTVLYCSCVNGNDSITLLHNHIPTCNISEIAITIGYDSQSIVYGDYCP